MAQQQSSGNDDSSLQRLTVVWSDEIKMEDFAKWMWFRSPGSHYVIGQCCKLVSGAGITYVHWEDGVSFRNGTPISFSHDFDVLEEEAKQFELDHGPDRGNGWLLKHPIKLLKGYKQARYPTILQRRNRERLYTFAETTKRTESASALLGGVEEEGILRTIYSFL